MGSHEPEAVTVVFGDNCFARERSIFEMWMACHTQEQIAEAVGLHPTDKALRVSGNLADLPKNQKAAADHATDFDPPIYNV